MGICATAVNLLFIVLLFGVEALISYFGWIPERSDTFLYLADRNLFRLGDTIGLSIVAFCVGKILSRTGFSKRREILIALAFVVFLTMWMHNTWLWQEMPDSGYPVPGEASLLGWVHLPYVVVSVMWILLGLRNIFNPKVKWFTLGAFIGGIVWWVAANS